MSADTAKPNAYHKLHRFRHIWLRILIALITLGVFVITVRIGFKTQKRKAVASLLNSMYASENCLSFQNQQIRLNQERVKNEYSIYLTAYADQIFSNGCTEELLRQMNGDSDKHQYFYIDKDGSILSAENAFAFSLAEDEDRESILKESYFEGDGFFSLSIPAGDGKLIVIYDDEYYYMDIGDMINCSDHIIFCLGENDAVIYASELAENSTLPDSRPDDGIRALTKELSGGDATLGSGVMYFDAAHSARKSAYYISKEIDRGMFLYVYVPVRDIMLESLIHAALPFIIMLLFAILAYRATFSLRQTVKSEPDFLSGFKKISNRVYIHLPSAERLVPILIIAMLIALAFSTYARTLSHYSSFYSEAAENLKRVDESITRGAGYSSASAKTFEKAQTQLAEYLASLIAKDPDRLNEEGLKKMLNISGADEIDIIDGNGRITSTTGAYLGYTLSSVTEDPEFQCWDLLKGDSASVLYSLADGRYQVAVRRIDKVGIIRLTFPGTDLNRMLALMTPTQSIRNTNYSGIIYEVEKNSPGIMFRVDANKEEIMQQPSIFTLSELENNSLSVKRIDGVKCCILSLVDTDKVLINAMSESEIVHGEGPAILVSAAGYLLLCWALVVGCCLYSGNDYRENEKLQSDHRRLLRILTHKEEKDFERKTEYSALFGRLLNRTFTASLITLILFFLLNWLLSDRSVVAFMISDKWSKGLNIFALTMVLMMILSAYCACRLIKWICRQLEQFLDPSRSTGIKLVSSALRVVCVAWVFFTGLYQLGVDLSTIVAGLGITTLALSIGAKDTVNDLIAGVFIVLEGHIRVGDYIEVNGFYGEVIDMNIRTTKVKHLNKLISINNSEMVNVINRSRGKSFCDVSFIVPFDTNIAHIKEIIDNNADRFLEEGKGMFLEPPFFCHVTELGNFGIECLVRIPTLEKNSKAGRCLANEIVVTVLQENGILLAHEYLEHSGVEKEQE